MNRLATLFGSLRHNPVSQRMEQQKMSPQFPGIGEKKKSFFLIKNRTKFCHLSGLQKCLPLEFSICNSASKLTANQVPMQGCTYILSNDVTYNFEDAYRKF
jgi:hypothetical protein